MEQLKGLLEKMATLLAHFSSLQHGKRDLNLFVIVTKQQSHIALVSLSYRFTHQTITCAHQFMEK